MEYDVVYNCLSSNILFKVKRTMAYPIFSILPSPKKILRKTSYYYFDYYFNKNNQME